MQHRFVGSCAALCLALAGGGSSGCITIEPSDGAAGMGSSVAPPAGGSGSATMTPSEGTNGSGSVTPSPSGTGGAASQPTGALAGSPAAPLPAMTTPAPIPPIAGGAAPTPRTPPPPGTIALPANAPAWTQATWTEILADGFSAAPSAELQALAGRVATRVSQADLDAVAAIDWTTITPQDLAGHAAFLNVLTAVEAEFPTISFLHARATPPSRPSSAFAQLARELFLPGRAHAQEGDRVGIELALIAVGTVVLTAAAGLAAGAAATPIVGVAVAAGMLGYLLGSGSGGSGTGGSGGGVGGAFGQ